MKTYALEKCRYPKNSLHEAFYPHERILLIEGLSAKDIVMDIVQVAASSGAVVGTSGAGGDVVTDAIFAIEIAADVLEEVQNIISEAAELGSIIMAAAKLDFAGNSEAFYNDVKGLIKRTVSSELIGDKAKEFIDDAADTVTKLIGKIVRAVSKWVAALMPDDFGLSGPAFEATMSAAISAGAENAYNLATAAVSALGETGKLITDSAALETFLTEITESILEYAKEIDVSVQNPDPDKSGIMKNFVAKRKYQLEKMVAPTAWALRKAGLADTDTMAEDYFDYIQTLPAMHPHRLILQKMTPKAIFILEEVIADWIPTAAKVMHKLISWLFAAIAVFQMIMDPTERKELMDTETRESDFDPLEIEDTMSDISLAAHRYLSDELLLREIVRLKLENRL